MASIERHHDKRFRIVRFGWQRQRAFEFVPH
jgi:hypothetical protein